MFSSRNRAERTAAQAWDYLSSAMTTAGDSARGAGGHTADAAARFADQVDKLAGQAGKRGNKLAKRANQRSRKLARKANQRGSSLAGLASDRGAALAGLASDRGAALAGLASDKADVAWSRASAAADALAGRKRRPWGLIIGATLVGGAVGFAAAGALRATQEREAENGELEMADNAVIVTPSYDD
jgi:hypothetical protein